MIIVVKTILNKNRNAPFEKPCNDMDHNEKIKSNRNVSVILPQNKIISSYIYDLLPNETMS